MKYDYSFKESLLSLAPIVEKTYLALDPSDDSTEEELKKIPSVKIIPSVWDMNLKNGLVLSVETNKALSALRTDHGKDLNAWGIYLQADEVIHESDYELLKRDIQSAQESGYDALSFRYLHFWQTHHHLAIAKNWYPHEVRAIKLNSNVVSWGDAQGFKHFQKIFYTEARIFHYGHVRDQSIYKKKMEDMSRLYNTNETLTKYYNVKDRDKEYTDCLLYFGTHPQVMKDRIQRMNDIWELAFRDEIFIVGNSFDYSAELIKSIAAKKVNWISKRREAPKNSLIIDTRPGWIQRLLRQTKVPIKMKSKSARPWGKDFLLTLHLSEKEVGLTHS